jgi:hypothetical protein
MKADIGRVTFEPAKHYQRVVMQQGRVQLESDWNEQVAILVGGMRRLAADLIGPWGGTAGAFWLEKAPESSRDLLIGAGRYYVDGILCVNDGEAVTYLHQPHFPVPEGEVLRRSDDGDAHYLAYLDVWERLVTAAEDQDILEVALGGPDTAARAQVVWQVRVLEVADSEIGELSCKSMPDHWPDFAVRLEPVRRGRLRARAKVTDDELDRPCAIDPRAAYRFDENALFRVEIHRPGDVGEATFKWSMDNGAVAFPIERFSGTRVAVQTLGRDVRLTLEAGDWVELESDASVLQNRADPLFRVEAVDYSDRTVVLDRAPSPVAAVEHPRLRRWDQQGTNRDPLEEDGTIRIVEVGASSDAWVDLRHGVQIQFVAPSGDDETTFRTGDFWLIPGRTSIDDVVWPQEPDADGALVPAARPPHGVEHHYAPLAHVVVDSDGQAVVGTRFVRTIAQLAECPDL